MMPPALDALEAELAAMTARGEASVAKVDLIHALAEELVPRTPERILELNEEALALSERLEYPDGKAFSLAWVGWAQYMGAQYEASLKTLHRGLVLAEEAGCNQAEAYACTNLIFLQQTLGNHDEALAAGLRAIPLYEALPQRVAWLGWNLLALGGTYLDLHEYGQALAMTTRSLALFDELGIRLGRARALVTLASIAHHQDRYREALPHLEQSLALFEELKDPLGASRTLNDLGGIYQRLGDLDEALALQTRGLRIREALGNTQAQCTSLIDLGLLHLERDDLDEAHAVLHRALDIAEAIQAKPKALRAHEGLAEAYERRGDPARALAHYRAFHELKEEVAGEEMRTALNHLQIRYAVGQAEAEAEIERLKNVELQGLLDELRAAQAQLLHAQKMASLGQLTAGIAHELKNPLNFVTNFAKLSVELADELAAELDAHAAHRVADVRPGLDGLLADLRANAEKISEHSRRADSIVLAMMAHAQGRRGTRQRVALHRVLDEAISLAVSGRRASVPGEAGRIETDYDPAVGEVEMVPPEIARVVMNLIGNAFDAVAERAASADAPFSPTITVATRRRGGQVEIRVSDNGTGIPAAVRETLFEPFVTTKAAGSRTGLGLSLSHDIVTQGHRGTLTVESTDGEGATFVVTLPEVPPAGVA